MCLFGEAALEDDAKEGGGFLTCLEERPLPQLRFRLAVVILRRRRYRQRRYVPIPENKRALNISALYCVVPELCLDGGGY